MSSQGGGTATTTSKMSEHPAHDPAGLESTSDAISSLTADAAKHHNDPKHHLLAPANHPSSHTWLSKLFPPATLESLESRWHLGNYVIDRKTGEKTFEAMSIYVRLGMHVLYYGSYQEEMLQSQRAMELLKAESVKMGKEYDSPASKAHIQPFMQAFQLEPTMIDMVQPDPSQYKTFNEFFGRQIKPEARPVDEPGNTNVVSSPADCRLTVFPTTDAARKYWIKGYGFTLAKLLGDDSIAARFAGGPMMIARLAPQDYHRWHSPCDGTVIDALEIPGTYYTVNPQAINEPGTMDVFCQNRRSVMGIERPNGRRVAVVAVGAMLVGSIKYMAGVQRAGTKVKRGECLGTFYYGGSTVIVCFEKGDELVLDDDLVKNSCEQGCETLVRVGWRVGVSQS